MIKRNTGFTLIELLITLAIVAILAGVSHPLYTHHVIKVKRERAALALMQVASRLEEAHNLQGSYENATAESLHLADLISDKSYILAIDSATTDQFTISAKPNRTREDNRCGTLKLNERGERFISGSGTVAECWF